VSRRLVGLLVVLAVSWGGLAVATLALWKEKEPEWMERAEWVERRSKSGRR